MSRELYFIVTVDTEADDAWNMPEKLELKNLDEVPRFQELCEKYNVIPTYLVTYECATRDEALSILKPLADAGRCEIGHHLHSWTTPPFQKEDPSGIDAAWLHAYQSELPDTLFREKSEFLYNAIEKAYGKKPTSHRAGRWGIDQRSIDWLIENHFKVDSSVVPLTSYSGNSGKKGDGPSFYSASREPYFCYSTSVNGKNNASLMEIPINVDIPGNLFSRACAGYLRREFPGTRHVNRLFRRIGGGRLLRPDPEYPDQALCSIIERTIKADIPIVHLMIHSSELSSGHSPFSRTIDYSKRVWIKLEEVFRFVKELGIISSSLSDAATFLKNNK